MDSPREHLPEDARWDYRVTLVYPSVAAYVAPGLPVAERRRMYPDTAAFTREERRRFELLLAHWDVPVVPVTRIPDGGPGSPEGAQNKCKRARRGGTSRVTCGDVLGGPNPKFAASQATAGGAARRRSDARRTSDSGRC
jgi:hypothetical protein